MMKIFRIESCTRLFSLLTAVIFLNMSFFVAEVCFLDISDKHMIENISNLVLNSGLEEERDAHSGDTSVKLFSLTGGNLLLRHSSLFVIAARIHRDAEDHYRHANYAQKFSPPPDYTSPFS